MIHSTVADSVSEAFVQMCGSRGENVSASPVSRVWVTSPTVTRGELAKTKTNSWSAEDAAVYVRFRRCFFCEFRVSLNWNLASVSLAVPGRHSPRA